MPPGTGWLSLCEEAPPNDLRRSHERISAHSPQAPEQGTPLPSRSAPGRGNHGRHAPRRPGSPRNPDARPDRRPLASWPSNRRSSRPGRVRPRAESGLNPRSPRQGRAKAHGRHGRLGLGAPSAVARSSLRAPHRPALLRDQRPRSRTTLVEHRSEDPASSARRPGWREAAIRSSSASSCPRGGDGARGGSAQRHPAPAWSRPPRRDFGLSTGNRPCGDRRDGPDAERAGDPSGGTD